jgi:hypothetical protein
MRTVKLKQGCLMLSALAMSSTAPALRVPQFGTVTPVSSLAPPLAIRLAVPCKSVEPFDIDDYDGPFNKLVARFSERVEKATVHMPRRHNALKPCALNAGEKFRLFVDQETDPLNFLGAAWDAGWAQLDVDDPSFGQGARGYGKRYIAVLADNATADFFGVFFYPTIFHQDPRYYRLGQGGFRVRLGHALKHRFITVTDSGNNMFNFSEWCGTISSKAVTNLYHPGNPRGFAPTAERVGLSVAGDMGWDVLREFWPEVAHKFKLPFRTHEDEYPTIPHASPSGPAPAAAPGGDSSAVDLH